MTLNVQPIPRTKSKTAVSANSLWRLSLEQYHQMIEAGILTDDDHIELLEGLLVNKMPKKPSHSLSTQLVGEMLSKLLSDGWFINFQEPITLKDSEPEPDVVVVHGERRNYFNHHPYAQQVAIVIEVADATLKRDRALKKRLYAEAGILVYWIVNLLENQVEVYTNPVGQDYRDVHVYRGQDEVPVVVMGREIGRISAHTLLP